MQHFNGLEYLKIDIANTYGHDKELWIDRLAWVDTALPVLEDLINGANEPMLFMKAVAALRKTEVGLPSGHAMFLDATASGLQVMAALSGCKATASHVNMVNNGKRNDVYEETANIMNNVLPIDQHVTRELVKKPLMTHYYNKSKQSSLSELQQVAFYDALVGSFAGAEAVKNLINEYWDPLALEHSWTLPDGHIAKVRVTEMVNTRIEVDELNHTTFMYRFEANKPSERSTSLVPNVIHSIDAYIAREMVRMANTQGFQLAHIHDAFCAHPNNMDKVRTNYMLIMAEIADSDLLADILTSLRGKFGNVHISKLSNDLSTDIMNSEYMLS